MILEARAEDCFSTTHVLKINGQAVGKFEGRYFSEGLDLALTGMRRFKFEKPGFFTNQFHLKDAESGALLAQAQPAGVFSSTWTMKLTGGPAELRKAGWFSSAYDLLRGKELLAHVDRLGACQRGWRITALTDVPAPDLILVGLVFYVIQKRQQQHAAAAAAHGS
jgi:hypothetical protein